MLVLSFVKWHWLFKELLTSHVAYAKQLNLDFGDYQIDFRLQRVSRVSQYIARPAEMAELERVLLPERQSNRQKRFVLHGLGGIGKTQLAVEFASQHHRRFSAVFWLDGRSKDSIIQSIASCASRIPDGQISQSSTSYAAGSTSDINAVVREVMDWLARGGNDKWLLVFDNVDRAYNSQMSDVDVYDVKQYFCRVDHGSILITTRLAELAQLGKSWQLRKVSQAQARAMLQSRYKVKYGEHRHNPVVIAYCIDVTLTLLHRPS